jgi:hypothetical protein
MIVSIRAKKRDGDSDLFFQMGVHYCSVGLKKELWLLYPATSSHAISHPSVDFVLCHILARHLTIHPSILSPVTSPHP